MKSFAVVLERLSRVLVFVLIVWIPGSQPLRQSEWAREWEKKP